MPPNRFESEVESFLEGSHGDRTHIKRADHHTVTPLCGTLLEIPDRFTRRGQYLGFGTVLASLAVIAYAIYTNHPLIAGIIGALNLVALAAVFVAPDRASKSEE